MNSLRTRLLIGFSLIAIVPLAIAMVVLSQRIQETVRDQAADRLEAALGGIDMRLHMDRESMRGKLDLLAQDPELKRLVLVQPLNARALSDVLNDKRFPLGLDALHVSTPSGAVVADAADAPSALTSPHPDATRLTAQSHWRDLLQFERVEGDSALAMVASAPIRYQADVAAVVRGAILLDRALLENFGRTTGIELILRDGRGRLVASTLGRVDSSIALAGHGPIQLAGRGSYLARTFELDTREGSRLTGLASTATADQAIAALQVTAVTVGLLGLAVAIGLALLWSHQVSAPVERLARFSERIARGEWDEPLTLRSVRELETLVSALDRMRTDLRSQRARLVSSERHAAWSVMARAVAHEVRNPLTPIAVSVADLKRSYEQQRPDFPQVLDQAVRTIGDEIESLKRMLHEFSELGRFPEPELAPCRLAAVIADLETLYTGDVADGRLTFAPVPADALVRADRGQLRQALVNLVKNGLEAIGPGGCVDVTVRVDGADAEIAISDSGPGLDAQQQARLFEPQFTTKPHGSGLGLTIVHRIVNDHGGTIVVDSAAGAGTTFRVRLPLAPEEER